MIFVPYNNWKTLFFIWISCYHRVSVTAMLLCSLKQVFWKESVFYARYLCNSIKILLTPKVQTKASTYRKTLSFCVNVQHFSLWMKLLKLNISLEACFFLLKELRNCILCVSRMWSLFCSIRDYLGLPLLRVLFGNYCVLFLFFLLILCFEFNATICMIYIYIRF